MERNRYKGSGDDLCQAIMPFATSKSFVRFSDTEDLAKLKVDKDMKNIIADHAGLPCIICSQICHFQAGSCKLH